MALVAQYELALFASSDWALLKLKQDMDITTRTRTSRERYGSHLEKDGASFRTGPLTEGVSEAEAEVK